MGGHGSFGSVSSSLMGVTLGYPSGHPDPHSSRIASAVESQSTSGSAAATGISTATTATDDTPTGLLARQPPIGIETAAATNPTIVRGKRRVTVECPSVRLSVRLSHRSTAAAAAGGFAAELGRGHQISIDGCCRRVARGPRKFRPDGKEVQHT